MSLRSKRYSKHKGKKHTIKRKNSKKNKRQSRKLKKQRKNRRKTMKGGDVEVKMLAAEFEKGNVKSNNSELENCDVYAAEFLDKQEDMLKNKSVEEIAETDYINKICNDYTDTKTVDCEKVLINDQRKVYHLINDPNFLTKDFFIKLKEDFDSSDSTDKDNINNLLKPQEDDSKEIKQIKTLLSQFLFPTEDKKNEIVDQLINNLNKYNNVIINVRDLLNKSLKKGDPISLDALNLSGCKVTNNSNQEVAVGKQNGGSMDCMFSSICWTVNAIIEFCKAVISVAKSNRDSNGSVSGRL